jgi:hypothetical protein
LVHGVCIDMLVDGQKKPASQIVITCAGAGQ